MNLLSMPNPFNLDKDVIKMAWLPKRETKKKKKSQSFVCNRSNKPQQEFLLLNPDVYCTLG